MVRAASREDIGAIDLALFQGFGIAMISPYPLPQPCPVEIGSIIRFSYPNANEIGRLTRLRQRVLLVREVRDTSLNPIEPWAIVDNPLRRRGRWLIKGIDLDLGEDRSFYWESMRTRVRDTWLRLATFDPIFPAMPLDIIGGLFAPTREDRLFLSRVIRKYNAWAAPQPDIVHGLGVYSSRDCA